MTDHELQAEFIRLETQLIAKISQSVGMRRKMIWANIGTIISTITLLILVGIAWGNVKTTVEHIQMNIARVEGEEKALSDVVSKHHENTDRHVDVQFKEAVRKDLTDIRNMLYQHIQR